MKLRRLFCCLLLFVFIFSVVFSVSAFAQDVNGNTVTNRYALGDSNLGPLLYEDFNTTITSNFIEPIVQIESKIDFSTPIGENAIFDLTVSLDYSSAESISVRYVLLDSDGLGVGQGDATIENKKIILRDLVVDGKDCSSIKFYFTINNPSWQEQIIEEPSQNYNLSGTWVFNETIDIQSYYDNVTNRQVSFSTTTSTYGVVSCLAMPVVVTSHDGLQLCYTFNYEGSGYTRAFAYYDADNDGFNWYDNAPRSITFDGTQTVSKEFYDWFTANASKVSTYDVALASTVNYTYNFTITDVSSDITDSGEEYSGIIGWIKNVWNSITRLPALIANSISGFFSALGDEIVNLGTSLLDGIKGLFVPTEDDIVSIKGKFEQLLEDRFGAVYDSAQIIDDFANAFNSQSQSAMIESGGNSLVTFPSITVNLAGTEFAFGGWEVDLVPDKFEPIIEILKLITNIVCTFSFVNAMKRKLEGLLT